MKKQLLFIASLLFSFFVYAQTNHLTARQLRGKVRSVTETTYEVVEKFGEPEKGKAIRRDFVEFNNAGFETLYRSEDLATGRGKTVKVYKYQDKSRLVEIKEESDGRITVTNIEYNPQGKAATVDISDDKGNLTTRQKHTYDANGLLVQTHSYLGDGSLKFKLVRSYNAKGLTEKKEWFDAKGKSTWAETFMYDDAGNLVEEISVNTALAEPWPTIRKYKYNEKKQKIEEQFKRTGSSSALDDFTESFEYNEQGDLVKKAYLFQEETIVYTYDGKNNWIKAEKTSGSGFMEELLKQKPKREIVERQVQYY